MVISLKDFKRDMENNEQFFYPRRAIADKKASEKSATACNECDSYWENLGYNKLRNKMLTANEIKNYVVEKCAPFVFKQVFYPDKTYIKQPGGGSIMNYDTLFKYSVKKGQGANGIIL